MKKKIFSIVLSLCMVLTMMPMATGVAWAADATRIEIYPTSGTMVEMVTNEYFKNDGTVGSEDDYNAKYDPDSNTLTLNGLIARDIYISGDITINLVDRTTSTLTNDAVSCIDVTGDLTITGPGTLNATRNYNSEYLGSPTIKAGGNIFIKGEAIVTATNYTNSPAIKAETNISISGASTEVTAINNFTDYGSKVAISAVGSINISNGAKLKATSGSKAVSGTVMIDGVAAGEQNKDKVKVGESEASSDTWDGDTGTNPLSGYKYLYINTVKNLQNPTTPQPVCAFYGDTSRSVNINGLQENPKLSFSVIYGSDVVDVDADTGALTFKKVGEAIVRVSFAATSNYYAGNSEVNVTVYKKGVTTIVVNGVNASYDYTGSAIEPSPTTVTADGTEMTSSDYQVIYGENKNAGASAGSITIKAKDTGNYNFTDCTVNFTIAKIAAESNISATVTAAQDTRYHVGEFNEPTFLGIYNEAVTGTLTYNISDTGNGATTVSDGDYDAAKASLANLASGKSVVVTWTFTPTGDTAVNYSGTKSGTITITASSLTPMAEPDATFNANGTNKGTLIISNYATTMKYSVDGGSTWNTVTGNSMEITNVTTANGIKVKNLGDDITTIDSIVKVIDVTQAVTPNSLTVTQPSTIGGKGGIETTNVHEYSMNGTNFTLCDGALTNLDAGTYYVRVAASGTALASANAEYTITAFIGTKETPPNAIFTATGDTTGTLSNVKSGMKYSTNGGGTWTDINSDDDVNLTNLSDGTISVVKKGNGTTTLDSDSQSIIVGKAAIPTGVTTIDCTTSNNNNGKLQNVTNLMEYRKSDASNWTNCGGTEVVNLTNGTYYVRVKATGTTLASDYQTVQIEAYNVPALDGSVSIEGAAKYGVQLTANTSGITNNTGTLSYQWKRGSTNIGNNSSTYTIAEADIGSTITVTVTSSDHTGSITSLATSTIEKADGPSAPTGLIGVKPNALGGADGKITGTSVTMEYSTDSSFNTPAGTACAATETTGLTAGTYYVRFKETDTHKAGANATVTVPAGDASGGNSNSGSYAPSIQKPTIIADEGSETTLSIYGDKLTIKVAEGYEVTDVLVNGVSKGKVTELTGLKTGDKVEIKTEKKQEEPQEPTKEEIIATLNSYNLVARSKVVTMKNGKKAIRIRWYDENDLSKGMFDGVEIYRSTKSNTGYGKKPVFVTSGGNYCYYNTAIELGTKYYYKVRGFVIIDGHKYYTDFSLKAVRTAI